MKPLNNPITQEYNDGLLSVWRGEDTSEPGEFEKISLVKICDNIRYERKIVGFNRYVQNLQVNVRVSDMLRCPRLLDVNTFDKVITESGAEYQIEQIQYPPDVFPPSMDLSLSSVVTKEAIL